jgi:hypothetical protein
MQNLTRLKERFLTTETQRTRNSFHVWRQDSCSTVGFVHGLLGETLVYLCVLRASVVLCARPDTVQRPSGKKTFWKPSGVGATHSTPPPPKWLAPHGRGMRRPYRPSSIEGHRSLPRGKPGTTVRHYSVCTRTVKVRSGVGVLVPWGDSHAVNLETGTRPACWVAEKRRNCHCAWLPRPSEMKKVDLRAQKPADCPLLRRIWPLSRWVPPPRVRGEGRGHRRELEGMGAPGSGPGQPPRRLGAGPDCPDRLHGG